MKVVTDWEDHAGRTPMIFSGYKNIKEVRDYLWAHFQGYFFVIMINCMADEYEDLGNELYVYFGDEALEEIATMEDYKVVKRQ